MNFSSTLNQELQIEIGYCPSMPADGLSSICAETVEPLVALDLLPAFLREKDRSAGHGPVVSSGVDARLERFALDHHSTCIGIVVARSGHPLAYAQVGAEVVGELPSLGSLSNALL